MTEAFGNFTTESNESNFRLHYKRSRKDWSDLLVSGIVGIPCLLITFILFYYGYKENFHWIYIIFIFLFGFTTYLQLGYLISRLTEPTNNILDFDKNSGDLYVKLVHFKKRVVNTSELREIEYHLHRDIIGNSPTDTKYRYWVEVNLVTNNNDKIEFMVINTDRLLKSSRVQDELTVISKDLTKRISQELGIPSVYQGIVEEGEE